MFWASWPRGAAGGTALIERFHAVLYVLGVLLIALAVVLAEDAEEAHQF